MAIVYIPNQAVEFIPAGGDNFNVINERCTLDSRVYCQPITRDVDTVFQVGLTVHDGVELITDGDFNTACGVNWNCASWTISGNKVHTGGTTGTIFQAGLSLSQGKYYRVSFDVEGMGAADTLTVRIAGNNENSFTGLSDGFYTSYHYLSAAPASQTLGFFQLLAGSGSDYTIDSVQLLEVTIPEVEVQNCDGTFIKNVTDIEYSPFRGQAMITVDWSDVSNDNCYRICISPDGDAGSNLLSALDYNHILHESGHILVEDAQGNISKLRWI